MYTNYSSCLLSLFLLIIVNYIELQPVNAAACNESNTLELCPAGCYNSLIHNENDSYSLQNETNYLPGIDPSYTDRVCSSVPSGKYSPINDDNMYLCPDGTYSLNGSSNCTLCPRGSYNFGIGSSSCYKCSPGSYTNLLGSKQCLKCQPIIYFGIGTYNVKFEKDINGGGDDNNAICLPPDIATYTPTSVPTTFLPSSKPLSISISQRPIKKNEISNPTKNNNSKNPVKIKSSTISPIQSPTQYVSISTPTLALESPFKNTNQPSPETTFPLYVPTDFLVDDYIYHTGRPTEIQFLQPSLSSTIESGKTMIPTLTGSNIQQTIKPTTSLSNKPAFSTFFSDFQKKLLRDHENEKKLTYEEKVKRRRDRQRDEIIAFVLSFSIVIIMMLTTGYICSKRNEIIKKRKKEKKLKKQMQLLEQQIKNRPKPLPPPKTAEYGYYGPNPDIIINNDDDVKQTMIDTNKENNHSYEQLDNISIITTDDDLNDIENGNMQSNKSKN